jgi:ribosomal protein S16
MYSIKLIPTSRRGGKIVLQSTRSSSRSAYIEKIGFFNFDSYMGYKFVALDYTRLAFYLSLGAVVSNVRLRKFLAEYGSY